VAVILFQMSQMFHTPFCSHRAMTKQHQCDFAPDVMNNNRNSKSVTAQRRITDISLVQNQISEPHFSSSIASTKLLCGTFMKMTTCSNQFATDNCNELFGTKLMP